MRTATVATSVRLGLDTHTMIKDYSEATGIPMSKVLDVALVDWLSTVGAARLEALARNEKTESKHLAKILKFQAGHSN